MPNDWFGTPTSSAFYCLVTNMADAQLITQKGHFHDDVIFLQPPEFISFLLSYLILSILLRFKKQQPLFAQENNRLKGSGSCRRMTSSRNCSKWPGILQLFRNFLCDTDTKYTEIPFKLPIKKTKPLSLTVRFMTWHSEITRKKVRQKVIIS